MPQENTATYLKSAELRFFWVFLVIAAVLLIADFNYLSPLWATFHLVALMVLGSVIFWSGYHLAKANLARMGSSSRLEGIIANLSDGVMAYDNNFKILVFNNAAERIFKIKKEEATGQRLGPERAVEAKYKTLTQAMFPSLAPSVLRQSEAGTYPQVVDISFPDQELRVSTDRLMDEKGAVLCFVRLVQDRTREVELLRSKSEFITIAAHQLRTPLTAINWIFEGFEKNAAFSKEDKELAVNGLTATRKLLKIVNDLLDVSKIEEGRFGYNFAQTDLVGFMSDVLTNAQAEAKEHGVNLYLDRGSREQVLVTIDQDKLGMAVSNLIDNAIRYNVENGSVTVSVKQLSDGPYVEVVITDTGIGIPPQDMSKVFSKFFRAENVLRRETEGSGLGLYITKNNK